MDSQIKLYEKLDTLLDSERQALLEGDFSNLSKFLLEKEYIMDTLHASEKMSPASLQPLNEKAERNQALLERTMDGIRSAASKLADLRQAKRSFDTYDYRGQKNRIEPDTQTSVEKHA
ncbi:MAG: flagellar biosynthesis protein FlgN [Aliishimia sp.]